jgi:hypothetical protein
MRSAEKEDPASPDGGRVVERIDAPPECRTPARPHTCPYDISTARVPLFTQPLRRPDYPRAMIDVLLLATTLISFVFFFALVRWFDRI